MNSLLRNLRSVQRVLLVVAALFSGMLAMSHAVAAPYLYLANQNANDVLVIDVANSAVRDVIGAGLDPVAAVLGQDGRRLYTANSNDNTMTVIDTQNASILTTISVGAQPDDIVLSPDGRTAYVSQEDGVGVVDLATNKFVETLNFGLGYPSDVAVSQDSRFIFAINGFNADIAVVDTSTLMTVDSVSLPFPCSGDSVSASPDGTRMYVSSIICGCMFTIDPLSRQLLETTQLWGGGGDGGVRVLFTADNQTVYMSNIGGDAVYAVDATTGAMLAKLPYIVFGMDFDHRGNGYFVGNGLIAKFSTISNEVTANIPYPLNSAPTATASFLGFPRSNVFVAEGSSSTITLFDPVADANTNITTGNSPSAVVVDKYAHHLYVTNAADNSVSTISNPSGVLESTISVGNHPASLALSPDGKRLMVANAADDSVSVIDLPTSSVIATISLDQDANPLSVVYSNDGSTVYVSNGDRYSVSVISAVSNTVTGSIPVGIGTHSLVASPDGSVLYVTSSYFPLVTEIDTSTNAIIGTVATGGVSATLGSTGISVSPDGQQLYVANSSANSVSIVNVSTGNLRSIQVGSQPVAVADTPDGRWIYVANKGSNSLSVIDAITDQVVREVSGFSAPVAIGNFTEPMTNLIFQWV